MCHRTKCGLSCSNSAETLRLKSEMQRNTEVPPSLRDEALFIPPVMREESQGGPCNAKGDLTSLRKHEWSPRSKGNWRGTLSFQPQLHPTDEILACKLNEALLYCSLSKEIPRFLWKSKGSSTCFTKLQKFSRHMSPLQRNAEIPATSQEEPCYPRLKSR